MNYSTHDPHFSWPRIPDSQPYRSLGNQGNRAGRGRSPTMAQHSLLRHMSGSRRRSTDRAHCNQWGGCMYRKFPFSLFGRDHAVDELPVGHPFFGAASIGSVVLNLRAAFDHFDDGCCSTEGFYLLAFVQFHEFVGVGHGVIIRIA